MVEVKLFKFIETPFFKYYRFRDNFTLTYDSLTCLHGIFDNEEIYKLVAHV